MAAHEKFAVLSAKVPTATKEGFEALARRRAMTPSALMKRLVEAELAGRADYETGDVEAATRTTLEDRGVSLDGALAASALNVARRLDRDPTSGPANSAQHQRLMRELAPSANDADADTVLWLKLSASFRRRGWRLSDGVGSFDLATLDPSTRTALIDEMRGRRAPGGVPAYEPAAVAPALDAS